MKAALILIIGLTFMAMVSNLDAACIAMHMGTTYLSGGVECK